MEKIDAIRVLHISDIHFGSRDEKNEREVVIEGLLESLRISQQSVDLIVCTGDVANSGSPFEFQQGLDFLLDLQSITQGKIALCPGNHDVDRRVADVNSLRLAYANEESFSRSKAGFYKSLPHLANYFKWYSSVVDEHEEFLPLWSSNKFACSHDLDLNGIPVRVVAINTSALSCGNDDEGKLAIDIAALNSALAGTDENRLVLCIGHHPIESWLTEWNSIEVNTLMNRSGSPHAYFHGHLHEQDTTVSYSSGSGGICKFSGGAAYQGSDWPQYYSIVDFNFGRNLVSPTVVVYNKEIGKWISEAKLSQDLPVKLPKMLDEESVGSRSRLGPCEKESVVKWKNPFDNVASNSLDAHVIPKLFVDENNFLNRISKRFDSVLEGQRGTGKTMLLRYLSIEVQREIAFEEGVPLRRHLADSINFFGIYSNLSNAGLSRSDYQLVESRERRNALFNHRLTVQVLSDLISTCAKVCEELDEKKKNHVPLIAQYISKLLRIEYDSDINSWHDLENYVVDNCDFLLSEIDSHLSSLLPGGITEDFNPWLTLSSSLRGLLAKLKRSLGLDVPFYMLFDDFDSLNKEQQEAIVAVARERNHSLMCFKYGIMSLGLKIQEGNSGGLAYKETDDYDHIMLQWHDRGLSGATGAAGNYKETVIKVANKRLEAFGWPSEVKFNNLYNNWTHGNGIRKEVKRECEEEYYSRSIDDRPKTFASYWSKQGESKYFRKLRAGKIEHKYSGPSAIIDLSSGIFRQFIEINSRIVAAALDTNWTPASGKKISTSVQNTHIRMYAKDAIRSLGDTAGDTTALSHRGYEISSSQLLNFTKCLIGIFSNRLYEGGNDAEVLAISVKNIDSGDSFARALLDIAVRESILQRRIIDYTSKTPSSERVPTYYLNRRLAPEGNLGLKMQGRIEIDIDQVELAAKDPAALSMQLSFRSGSRISRVKSKLKNSMQNDLF